MHLRIIHHGKYKTNVDAVAVTLDPLTYALADVARVPATVHFFIHSARVLNKKHTHEYMQNLWKKNINTVQKNAKRSQSITKSMLTLLLAIYAHAHQVHVCVFWMWVRSRVCVCVSGLHVRYRLGQIVESCAFCKRTSKVHGAGIFNESIDSILDPDCESLVNWISHNRLYIIEYMKCNQSVYCNMDNLFHLFLHVYILTLGSGAHWT